MKYKKNFFERNAEDVAKDLIGMELVRNLEGKLLSGVIAETEAHSIEQKRTKKFEGAFAGAGIIHMYPTQGKLVLAIATGKLDEYSEISIRALNPVEGIDEMKKYRNMTNLKNLTNGPGKLTQALQIHKDFDGTAIYSNSKLWIEGNSADKSRIMQGRGSANDACAYFSLKN